MTKFVKLGDATKKQAIKAQKRAKNSIALVDELMKDKQIIKKDG